MDDMLLQEMDWQRLGDLVDSHIALRSASDAKGKSKAATTSELHSLRATRVEDLASSSSHQGLPDRNPLHQSCRASLPCKLTKSGLRLLAALGDAGASCADAEVD